MTNEGDKNEETIPVLVETATEEDEAIAGNEEDEAIAGVLNSYLEEEFFGNIMEGGDDEEKELPHYIVN